jgi:hypothetical protein
MLFYIIAVTLAILALAAKTWQVQTRRREVAKEAQKQISARKWQQELDISAQRVLHARTPGEMLRVINSLDAAAISALYDDPKHRIGSPVRHASNKCLYYVSMREEREVQQYRKRRRHELIENLFAAQDLGSRLRELASLVHHERCWFNERELQEAIESYLDDIGLREEMFETARRDLQGYLEIAGYMKEVWYLDSWGGTRSLTDLRDFIAYPSNWYELVVQFRKDPAISEFPFAEKLGTTPMQIAENAAAAVRDRDLVGVQIARAHAANKAQHREMMGDVLLEQLHRLAAELHKEQGLFQDETVAVGG